MSAHRLDFGDLDLANADGGRVDESWWFETLAEGFSLGSPQAVKVIAAALMRNGSDSRIERHDNRNITFRVLICGPDLAALSLGERALVMQCNQIRSLLSWTPPDDFGATTDYVVLNADPNFVMDDLAEVRQGTKKRAYDVTLECLPFGRSPVPVTQTLLPTSTSPTVVDDCVATTNWNAVINTGEGTAVGESAVTVDGEDMVLFEWSFVGTGLGGAFGVGYVDYSGTKPTTDLVAFDVSTVSGSDQATGYVPVLIPGGTFYGASVSPTFTESVVVGSATVTRYWYENPGDLGTSWRIRFVFNVTAVQVRIANVIAADLPGAGGVMGVATEGSVRAEGSVVCSRPTDPIEWLFVYADPQLGAFSPRLPLTWGAGRDGTYVLYDSARTVGQVVRYRFTDTAGRQVFTLPTRIDAEVAGYAWQPVGTVELGGFANGLIGAQTVARSIDGGAYSDLTTGIRLFRLADDTTLVYLDDLSADAVTIQAPSIEQPYGGVWADGVRVNPISPGFPIIAVPSTLLAVEANDSDTSPVESTLDYFPAAHTFNAYVPPPA